MRSRKDVMAALDALAEAKSSQERPQIIEPNVGVSGSLEHLQQNLFAHTSDYRGSANGCTRIINASNRL